MDGFKEDFHRLLARYTPLDTSNNNKTPNSGTNLSNHQILEAIRDVLLDSLNIKLQNVEVEMKTPVNEIIITTPTAPDITRVDYNSNCQQHGPPQASRYNYFGNSDSKSSDLMSFSINGELSKTSNDEILLKKISDNKGFEETASVKPFDVSIKENEELVDCISDKDASKPAKLENSYQMLVIVEEAHKKAKTVTTHLESLRQLLMPSPRPVRRLSSIMSLPRPKQQQQQQQQHHQQQQKQPGSLQTIQRSTALRRVAQEAAGSDTTPTTSRLSLGPMPPRKPPSSGQPKRPSLGVISDFGSNCSLNGLPKSPMQKTRNKYAHVQSTIPKPVTVKRKPVV